MFIIEDVHKKANEPQWGDYAPGIRALLAPWTRTLVMSARQAALAAAALAGEDASALGESHWNRALQTAIIRDIEGIVDANGAVLACTPEITELICECQPEFHFWAITESKKMGQLVRVETEKKTETLNSLPSGKRKKRA
jgi:hypothetical protein